MSDRPLPGWPRGLGEDLAAAYIGLSPSTFRLQVQAGEITAAVRLTKGRQVWLREDLDAYLDRKAGRLVTSEANSWDALTNGARAARVSSVLPQRR